MIQGDLRVSPDQSLEIGPGVIVFFAVHCSLYVDSAARLEAIGAENDSIYFTTDTLALPERWKGIQTHNDADTCRFEWCVFENANPKAINAGAPLRVQASSFRFNGGGSEGTAIEHGANFLQISNCVFVSNRGDYSGPLFLFNPRGGIENCIFEDNHATAQGNGQGFGGAIGWFSQIDSLVVSHCDFIGNSAQHGGAVSMEATGHGYPRFEDCRFINNTATVSGGAVTDEILHGGFYFLRCWFEGNQAPQGGAMWVYPADYLTRIDQCVFKNNSATDGGAIYAPNAGGAPDLQRCTIVNNTATHEGGGIYIQNNAAIPTIYSSIIAFNTGAGLRMPSNSASSDVRFNLLFGNSGGDVLPANNPLGHFDLFNFNGDSADLNYDVLLDPQFVDTSASDYHLLGTSPCIDAGPQAQWFPHDPDSTIADIGAFYYDQTDAADENFILHPSSFILSAFPNPFNATTEIRFELPVTSQVKLSVFDLLGREISVLVNERLNAGSHTIRFNAGDLPSGIYFCRLSTVQATNTHKLILLK
jgi:predicted outer membrane repeat protein